MSSNNEWDEIGNKITGTKYDICGYDREGYNRKGFNSEGIHRDTGTMYDPKGFNKDGIDKEGYNRKGFKKKNRWTKAVDREGYNKEGYDKEGYNKEGYDKEGYTREERLAINKSNRTKKFCALIDKATRLGKGEMSVEEYVKISKTSIDDLIEFAKKQRMDSQIVRGLYAKKQEYKRFKKPFLKNEYLGHTVIVVEDKQIIPTEQDVDLCLKYLKMNDRVICDKTVRDTVRAYVKGELDITLELQDDGLNLQQKEDKLQELIKQEAQTRKEMQAAKAVKEQYEQQLETKEGKTPVND